MRCAPLDVNPRTVRAIVWSAGLAALLAGTVAWVLPARPYEAPWAWISFIGMCVIDDYLLGSPAEAAWGQLPRVTLLAAIIVFRRHPEITLLIALVSAPLGSALKAQRPSTQVMATAQWMLAGVIGAAAFRAVGFESTARFVLATAVLMVIYYGLGPLLSAWLEARLAAVSFGPAFARQRRFAVSFQLAGVLLAMAWRTAALQPAALKMADGALVALAGIFAGFMFGGRPGFVFRSVGRIPERGALAGGAVLLLGLLSPLPFSWLLPFGLAVIVGAWATRRRAYPVLCCAMGALANELVRAVNDGLMPVEGSGLMSGLGAANTYVRASPHTALAFLDDRFQLPPPFPGIASAGDILIAVGLAWLVATVTVRRQPVEVAASDDEQPIQLAA